MKRGADSERPLNPKGAFFRGLSQRDISVLLDPASRMDSQPRQLLYTQGEPARDFFYLQTGLVKICELTPSGDEMLVRFVVPGEVFGYFGLVGGMNMTSAEVVRPGSILSWDRQIALELLQKVPKAATNLFSITVSDVLYFYERARRLRTEPVDKRVHWALSELIRAVGESTSEGVVIGYGAGQRELAELASTTIYTVSRELGKLEQAGLLRKQRGRILVFNPKRFKSKEPR